MLHVNSPEELRDYFIQAGRKEKVGMEIALGRRTHPILLVNTLDSRIKEWNRWDNIYIMTVDSISGPDSIRGTRVHTPVDYSALVVILVFWESALRGAKYFSQCDFFDFFDEGTVEWIRTIVQTKELEILVFLRGKFVSSFFHEYDQNSQTYYQDCLDAGLESKFLLMRINRRLLLADEELTRHTFGQAKQFLFSILPEDPYEAFLKVHK
jgi:hypothetical protein